jgi:glycosyltransferase involved in cell wall biosynthesis
MNTPAITVLMTIYNGRAYLAEAVASILAQTCRDFELLIINDGSTDDSLTLLKTYDDPRIRLIDQQPNRGIRATLNRGLHDACGRYVAIMDQDDVSAPSRLEKLLACMEARPELALCGSAIETFGDHPVEPWVHFFEPDDLKIALLFENPICHPSMMLRRSILETRGLEYPDVPYAEEYSLWVALSRVAPLANLREPLLRYRVHPQQVSRSRSEIQCASMNIVMRDQLSRLGLVPTEQELILHKMLGGTFNPLPGLARRLENWATRLVAANQTHAIYPEDVFARQLEQRIRCTLALNQNNLAALSWPRRLAWRLAVWRDFLRAGQSTTSPK